MTSTCAESRNLAEISGNEATWGLHLRLFAQLALPDMKGKLLLLPYGGVTLCGLYNLSPDSNVPSEVKVSTGMAACSVDDQFDRAKGWTLAKKRAITDGKSFVFRPRNEPEYRGVVLNMLLAEHDGLLRDWDRRIAEVVMGNKPISAMFLAPKYAVLSKEPSKVEPHEFLYQIDRELVYRSWTSEN
jgi:hypothetical protein